jgi:hypothetical protein
MTLLNEADTIAKHTNLNDKPTKDVIKELDTK